ncbi:hypothetical protein L6R49_12335 [Myxococcota bacterium]|nr:hypothetical protein [Myxococcota bacterium]
MRRLAACTLLLTAALAPALAARPLGAVERALEELRESERLATLDATVYPASPYTSPADLPPVLEVERPYQGFNDWYYFALVDGKVWFKPRVKRRAGLDEVVVDLPWKPFGHRDGLPYRLDHKDPSLMDTTYLDGNRGDFIKSRAFETEEPAQALARLDAETWAKIGAWPHEEPLAFDPEFPMPERLIALTADDDELAVLTDGRQMFYRRKFANLFVPDEWMAGWGAGKDEHVFVPKHLTGHRGWALGRITAAAAGYKEGPDGRIFEWGPAAVSMETMVWLSPDGRTIYYLDSGTPPEIEHFIEPPFRGRYRGEAIDASASTVMLLDRFGAVVTKIADFDLLGSTPTHPYCYEEECDHEAYYPPGDIRSGMSDIRLPPEGWTIHPPVLPPEAWGPDTALTRRVSMLQTGKGNRARELRIVGKKDGVIGSFHKSLLGGEWSFREAPPGDRGFWDIPAEEFLRPEELGLYTAAEGLEALHAEEPKVDKELWGRVEVDRLTLDLRVPDFNLQASPWTVEIRYDGLVLPLQLHVVQAWNRFRDPHMGPGKEHLTLVNYEGTFTFNRRELERLMALQPNAESSRTVREFLDVAKNLKFQFILNANQTGFELSTKAERRTGHFAAVALADDGPRPGEGAPLADWREAFWARLDGHMAWEQAAAPLVSAAPAQPGCDAASVLWAAETLRLQERIEGDLAWMKTVVNDAAQFSTFTFLTSGFFYLTQLKTLDAALDASRVSRSDEVRPNELRFNVITGITGRIPYLARNVSEMEDHRLDAARAEARRVEPQLKPLVKIAEGLRKSCP